MKLIKGSTTVVSKKPYKALGRLFLTTKILGLTPFIVHRKEEGFEMKFSTFCFLYGITLSVALSTVSVYAIVKSGIDLTFHSFASILVMFTMDLGILIWVTGLPFQYPHIFGYIKILNEIDSVIPQINEECTGKLSNRTLGVVMASSMAFITFSLIFWRFAIENLLMFLWFSLVSLLVYQRAYFVYEVETRLKNLRDCLNLRHLQRQPFSIVGVLRRLDKKNDLNEIEGRMSSGASLEDLIEVYLKISDAVDCINRLFGHIILIVLLECLVQITVHVYGLFSSKLTDYMKMTMEVLTLLLFFFQMLVVVEPCYRCLQQSKSIRSLVAKLQCNLRGSDMQESLALFSDHLLHYEIEFPVFGLGNVNRSVITGLAVTVTTYVVIIIQFENV